MPGHRTFEAVAPKRAGRCGQWAGGVRDTRVSETNQMVDRQAHPHVVVRDHRGDAIPRFGSIDQDHRKPALDAEADEFIVLRNGRQDQAVDLLAEQSLDKGDLLRRRVASIRDDRCVTLRGKYLRDAAKNRREHRIGDVGQQHTDEIGSAQAQIGSQAVWLIAERVGPCRDPLGYVVRHEVPFLDAGYPVPTDGPVGDMLRAQNRHPYRPAHIHFLGFRPGYKTLITQVFVDDDEHLESDVVFGVTRALSATIAGMMMATRQRPAFAPLGTR
jgi:hypothetical protein